MEFGRGGGGNLCSWDCALIRVYKRLQGFMRILIYGAKRLDCTISQGAYHEGYQASILTLLTHTHQLRNS